MYNRKRNWRYHDIVSEREREAEREREREREGERERERRYWEEPSSL
jgi:hypothetical protein